LHGIVLWGGLANRIFLAMVGKISDTATKMRDLAAAMGIGTAAANTNTEAMARAAGATDLQAASLARSSKGLSEAETAAFAAQMGLKDFGKEAEGAATKTGLLSSALLVFKRGEEGAAARGALLTKIPFAGWLGIG